MDHREIDELEAALAQRSAALETSEDRFRTIIDKNADAIVIVDRGGVVRFANPAAGTLWGRSLTALLGEPFGFPLLSGEAAELDIVRGDGQPLVAEMRVVETEWQGEPVYLASLRDVTARKQAEEALAWEAGVNAAVARLAKALIALQSLEEISSLVLEQAKQLTDSPFGFVGYIDPQSGFLVSPTLTRDIWTTCQVPDKQVVFEKFSGLWGWVLTHRQPLLTNAPPQDPRSSGVPAGHIPIQCFVSAPAMIGDTLVGMVALANAPRSYAERDLALVERLASLYALAVQRQRADELLRIQRDLAVTLSASNQLPEMLNRLLGIIMRVGVVDAGGVYLVDKESNALDLIVHTGLGADMVAAVQHYPADAPQARLVLAGKPIYGRYSDVAPQQDEPRRREGLRTLALIPVHYEGRVVAALNLVSHTQDEIPDNVRVALEAIAARIGSTIARVDAETALRISEERYSSLFNNNHTVMLLIDPENGNIVDANPAACDFYGYSREELTHKKITDINTLPASQVYLEMQHAFSQQCNLFHFRHRLANGAVQDVEVHSGRLQVHGQQLLYLIVHDITQRKQAEEALAQYTNELARSNAELQRFAYVASHHLQQPLRMIASYTSLLSARYADQLDETANEYIAHTVASALQMKQLIDGLLTYSQIDRQSAPREQIALDELFEWILDSLRQDIRQTNGVVTRDALPTVMANRLQLSYVLYHLLSNGLKFHGKSAPRVHVSAARQGREWLLAVRDNGIGIAPEYLEQIFEIFQRLHTPEEYPGIGVGLATCRKILLRHGGRLWAESQPGKGTTFYFTLPADEDEG